MKDNEWKIHYGRGVRDWFNLCCRCKRFLSWKVLEEYVLLLAKDRGKQKGVCVWTCACVWWGSNWYWTYNFWVKYKNLSSQRTRLNSKSRRNMSPLPLSFCTESWWGSVSIYILKIFHYAMHPFDRHHVKVNLSFTRWRFE